MKLFCFFLFASLILTSCGKDFDCPPENLFPAFVSYQNHEIDTIILRRFKLGNTFSQKIDSAILTINNTQFSRTSDTVTLVTLDLENRLDNRFDWQIYNPFDQKSRNPSWRRFVWNGSCHMF